MGARDIHERLKDDVTNAEISLQEARANLRKFEKDVAEWCDEVFRASQAELKRRAPPRRSLREIIFGARP